MAQRNRNNIPDLLRAMLVKVSLTDGRIFNEKEVGEIIEWMLKHCLQRQGQCFREGCIWDVYIVNR